MTSNSEPTIQRALPSQFAMRPWQGLVIGVACAVAVWIVLQAVHPIFRVGKEFDVPSIGMPTEKFVAHQTERDRIERKHAALYLGLLGGLLTMAIGCREAFSNRSWLMSSLAAPLGVVGGAGGGLWGAMILQSVRNDVGQGDLLHLVKAQMAVAAPLGLGVGLGFGFATPSIFTMFKTTLAGFGGGLLAAVIYPVIVSILLPSASTEMLLPEEATTRLVWLAVFSGIIGLAIPFAGR